jgi:hypothetical protein
MAPSWLTNLATAGLGFTGIYFFRDYTRGGVCMSSARLDGKTVVVTGCNTGIGKQTVIDMCRRGARVAMACRDVERAGDAANDARKLVSGADIIVYKYVICGRCRTDVIHMTKHRFHKLFKLIVVIKPLLAISPSC